MTPCNGRGISEDNRKPKNMEDITRRLMESVKDQKPWKDYTTIEINIANEEGCFKTLKALDEAEADARKRIIYFSCLKGQVFQRLKEISGKKMSQLLKVTDYSQAHAYFLMKLHNFRPHGMVCSTSAGKKMLTCAVEPFLGNACSSQIIVNFLVKYRFQT